MATYVLIHRADDGRNHRRLGYRYSAGRFAKSVNAAMILFSRPTAALNCSGLLCGTTKVACSDEA
jgi:hypothetical protein